jgi:hypothetical protein
VLPIRDALSGYMPIREDLARNGVILPPERIAEAMIHVTNLKRALSGMPLVGVPTSMRADKPVKAFVNHGRWLVQCECASAALTSQTDKRFFCIECGNVIVAGAWRPVQWPEDAEQIEWLLTQRANDLQQSWNTDMPVDELRHRNKLLGVGA